MGTGGEDVTPVSVGVGDAPVGEGARPAMDGEAGLATRRPHVREPRVRETEPQPPPVLNEEQVTLPGGGRLRIVARPQEGRGDPLPGSKRTMATLRRETEQRARDIAASLEPLDEPALALIELPNYRDPQQPEVRRRFGRYRDPKSALRLGMAHAGRLSKFVTSDTKGLRERCDKAVRDGLRHLGYLPAPLAYEVRTGPTPPADLTIAAVWFVRLTRKRAFSNIHLPIVVLLHTRSHEIKAWLPDGHGVRTYRQALLDVTALQPEDVTRRRQKDALAQLQHLLTRDLGGPNQDVVILATAQNARETWTGLNNAAIVWDHLLFDAEGQAEAVATRQDRIRVIRLRTNKRGETPEWYEPDGQAVNSIQGIWRLPGTRTYYNVGSKPHTMSGSREGKSVDPTEFYALPSILEIVPIAMIDDEGDMWATVVDQWRRRSYVTNGMTLLSLPLELARKMDKYAEVIGHWVFPDEWDEDEDDEDEDTEDEDDTGL